MGLEDWVRDTISNAHKTDAFLGSYRPSRSVDTTTSAFAFSSPLMLATMKASVRPEPKADSSPKKKKSRKLKRKKGSEEFTEGQKKELRNRETSDDSDSGGFVPPLWLQPFPQNMANPFRVPLAVRRCWSGYESTEGKKKGEKGSCKKKKSD